MTYTEFLEQYKPIDNQFDSKAPMNGKLYDIIEFSRIAPYSLRQRTLWTVVKNSDYNTESREYEDHIYIYPGAISKPIVIGYMVTEVPFKYGHDIVVSV